MAQMHFYVPDALADLIRQRAAQRGLSVSKFLAEVVAHEITDAWPTGYAEEVLGCWQGEPLERSPQGEAEQRQPL
jgi:hypothetical protein